MFKKKNVQLQDMLIYGKHPVVAALSNPKRKCKTIYVTESIWRELSKKFPDLDIKVCFREKRHLDDMLPMGSNHQNVVLEVAPLKANAIEDILEITAQKETSCLVILDQVTDPHNIGAIMRSAAAFAADAIILPDNNCPKENNTIIKCAAGATETLPMVQVTNLANCIRLLKKAGYWIIGLDGQGDQVLQSSIFSEKVAIILGSEDTGMRKLTRENCDYLVKIAISSNLESLNVSNAATIALYEFSRFANNRA